jgi:hypothetical protein
MGIVTEMLPVTRRQASKLTEEQLSDPIKLAEAIAKDNF